MQEHTRGFQAYVLGDVCILFGTHMAKKAAIVVATDHSSLIERAFEFACHQRTDKNGNGGQKKTGVRVQSVSRRHMQERLKRGSKSMNRSFDILHQDHRYVASMLHLDCCRLLHPVCTIE